MTRTIAIIDGDVVAYNSCESRYKSVNGVYTYTGAPPEYSTEEDEEYLEKCWVNFQRIVEETVEFCFADDYLMAVKSDINFRDEIYPDYKANRAKDVKKRNVFVPVIRQRAVDSGMAVEAVYREADDLLRMWSEQVKQAGDKFVICSLDKDLLCIPGTHFRMKSHEMLEVSEEEANKVYYEQLLKGDPSDNIPGIVGVGPVKAQKLLANCHTEKEFREQVINCYKLVYEDDWRNMLNANGKMIHLQRYPGDYFTVDEWLQELN